MAGIIAFDIFARDNASAVFEKLGNKVEHTESKFGSFAKKAAVVGLAVGAALAGVAVASVELASKFEDSQKRLEAALKASGTSFEALKTPIAAANKSMEKLGFTNTETADALANLTVATKNPVKSLKELGLAADLARFKHISLADAATALGKAMAGNLKPIKALGIDLPVAAGGAVKVAAATAAVTKAQAAYNVALKTGGAGSAAAVAAAAKLRDAQAKLNTVQHAGDTILKTLSERLHGQAQTAADTLSGKVDVLKTRFSDMGIQLGTVLIPALIKLVDVISNAVTWMQKHQAIAKALGIEIGALTVAFVALAVAMAITEVINPFGALALGVAAAVAGVIILYNRFAVARRIINDVGDAVMLWAKLNLAAFRLVADGARLLARGFLTFLLNPILTVFSAILHGAAIAFGWLGPIGSKLRTARDAFDKFRSDVNRIIGGIIDHKTVTVHASTRDVANAVAYIKRLMASIQDVNRTVYVSTVFNNPSSPFSSLAYKPHRAAGGPVSPGVGYVVNERGTETFWPNQAGTVAPAGGAGGGITINEVHVHGVQNTSQLWQELQKYAKRNGSIKLSGVTA